MRVALTGLRSIKTASLFSPEIFRFIAFERLIRDEIVKDLINDTFFARTWDAIAPQKNVYPKQDIDQKMYPRGGPGICLVRYPKERKKIILKKGG